MEMSTTISTSLHTVIGKDCPLGTAYKRKQFYKDKVNVVEPIEYFLDEKQLHTFQYVPVLKSILQVFANKDVVDKVVVNHKARTSPVSHANNVIGLFRMVHILNKIICCLGKI